MLPRVGNSSLKLATNWRWLINGESMPWYTSVRLIRQVNADDWTAPLKELAKST
jgi:hypothetical protein